MMHCPLSICSSERAALSDTAPSAKQLNILASQANVQLVARQRDQARAARRGLADLYEHVLGDIERSFDELQPEGDTSALERLAARIIPGFIPGQVRTRREMRALAVSIATMYDQHCRSDAARWTRHRREYSVPLGSRRHPSSTPKQYSAVG